MTDMKPTKNSKELNMEELDKISGGWDRSQLTPEEKRELDRLLKAYWEKAENFYDYEWIALRNFYAEMAKKYGGDPV